MTLVRLRTSHQFLVSVIERKGPSIVVFPGHNKVINDFIEQQLEILETWRPNFGIFEYASTVDVDDDTDACLLALYVSGSFVAATSRYHFAEHIEAWAISSMREFDRIMEEEEEHGE
ncbi:MAG: hypothetical protein Kow00107_06460 [Planctomycetota bacterium]